MGTNDLIQFTLAVDRGNKKIADLFEPHHPAVLKLILMVIQAARKKKIPVTICGEMAGNPLSALLLIGLGIEELSMRANAILEMKKFIRSLSFSSMKADAEKAVTMGSSEEINKFLEKKYLKTIEKMEFPSKVN